MEPQLTAKAQEQWLNNTAIQSTVGNTFRYSVLASVRMYSLYQISVMKIKTFLPISPPSRQNHWLVIARCYIITTCRKEIKSLTSLQELGFWYLVVCSIIAHSCLTHTSSPGKSTFYRSDLYFERSTKLPHTTIDWRKQGIPSALPNLSFRSVD